MLSVRSLEIYRGADYELGSQNSGLLPWDNAAPSSSANEPFVGSISNKSSGRKSFIPEVADTNIDLRSLSGSRRSSVVLGQHSVDSPGFQAVDLPDAPLYDYQLSGARGGVVIAYIVDPTY